ncbi:c-type cytochrome [Pseudaminobacter sp. 19-2017]|uniref:C-type cytochrome n=2 Tax=Pseudaminobacter soli (ex Zhang et al. 2022) TaxID=2831468 RepID=A0A942I9G2_9HYPH|nr:c-type cytochrome [Pseudaminobacter soli]
MRYPLGLAAAMLALAVVIVAIVWWFDHLRHVQQEADIAIGGVGERAIPIMLANGCAGCHTIQGVPGAQGLVGPKLDSTLNERLYLGGSVPNTSQNMVRWIRFSRQLDPHTAMPSTGISEQDARDIAAYLYALR